ncbi:MAG: hypothetical protein HYZ30_01890 [Candidatus Azosocius agrarius]|nr:MAG: hypothetical protein HYZ30_01890 [Gammaproteobacteria bacterium]
MNKNIFYNLCFFFIIINFIIFSKCFCNDSLYRMKFNFLLTVDYTIFEGTFIDIGKEFKSGSSLKKILSFISFGRIDSYFTNNIGLKIFDGKFFLNKVYINYTNWFKNFSLSVGKIYLSFGLEKGNCDIFLHKSVGTKTLYPNVGIGFKFDKWNKYYTFSLAINQIKQMKCSYSAFTKKKNYYFNKYDNFAVSARFAYRFIIDNFYNNLLQYGFSFYYENTDGNYLRYKSFPEATSRNTIPVLDTNCKNNRLLKAMYKYNMEFDFAVQFYSFLSNVEFHSSSIKNDIEEIFTYFSWHVQLSYIITGEKRKFIKKEGVWGNVNFVKCTKNVFELGFRYSFIDFEVGNFITTGRSRNKTFGINWYMNSNVHLFLNYIRSLQNPSINAGFDSIRRKLNILGIRFQYRY